MLGPSMIFLGTPIALGGSISAMVTATDRVAAAIALTVSALESLGVVALLVLVFS
jgi:hypothetical protein